MKQLIFAIACLLLMSGFSSCSKLNSEESEISTVANTTATTVSADTTKKTQANTFHVPTTLPGMTLPVYEPEKLEVFSAEEEQGIWELPYTPIYRVAYYYLPGYIEEIVGYDKSSEFVAWEGKQRDYLGAPPKAMFLKSFVQYFDIPKAVFVQAVVAHIKLLDDMGSEYNTSEETELPNPDIIYTFDNDIINEYYRRK